MATRRKICNTELILVKNWNIWSRVQTMAIAMHGSGCGTRISVSKHRDNVFPFFATCVKNMKPVLYVVFRFLIFCCRFQVGVNVLLPSFIMFCKVSLLCNAFPGMDASQLRCVLDIETRSWFRGSRNWRNIVNENLILKSQYKYLHTWGRSLCIHGWGVNMWLREVGTINS